MCVYQCIQCLCQVKVFSIQIGHQLQCRYSISDISSNVELSKRVGLSPTPCLERVRRLERQGYISGYTALLNPQYLDASLLVFVEITLNRGAPDVFEQFNTAVQRLDDIQEWHLVSGDFDYLLKTRVSDMSAYRKLLGDTLLRLPGVNDTRTYVVMEEVKQTNQLVIKTR